MSQQLVTLNGAENERATAVGPDGPLEFLLSPGLSNSVAQTVYDEVDVDSSFVNDETIVSAPITTTVTGGFLEIYWGVTGSGDNASTFYEGFLMVDGVKQQASRFTLDAASATFAFSLNGVKRMAIAPGAHTVIVKLVVQGGATLFVHPVTTADCAYVLVKEVRP
jgi:hypothetical protein